MSDFLTWDHKKSRGIINRYHGERRRVAQHHMFRSASYTSSIDNDPLYVYNDNHNEYENPSKRIRSSEQEAEQFGRAFGMAWKTFRQF